MVENIVGKGEKCWLQAFTFFTTLFSKDFLFRFVKRRDFVEKGKTNY